MLLGPEDKAVPKLVVGNAPHMSLLWSAYKKGTTLFAWSPSHACTQHFFGLHKTQEPAFPDRVDILLGGALAAGQWVEVAVPPQPPDSPYTILVPQIYVAGKWYPDSVPS